MKRIELVTESKCRNCGLLNELGCEIGDEPLCSHCDSTLTHEAEISYIDSCPLCDASFDEGKPFVFHSDTDCTRHWLCANCQHSPRGLFFADYEMFHPPERTVPRCCVCDSRAKLLVLTRNNEDGELLCHSCITSKVGLKMLQQHNEPSYLPGVREWFSRFLWRLRR